jgi:hypothetical protein
MAGTTSALERRDPAPSSNQYDHVPNNSGSSDDMEPWDEAPRPKAAAKKNIPKPPKSGGMLFCVDEFLDPSDQVDDGPLDDGDLPSLSKTRSRSRETPMGGRVVNGQVTTKKPMSPPSTAGLVPTRSTEKKQQQTASFWSQLDVAESSSNVDRYDDDVPDDERAHMQHDRQRTRATNKQSRESETYADEVDIDHMDSEDQNLCDYTLQSLGDICGSADPGSESALREPYALKRPTAKDELFYVEEQTAIEVEYVDSKRGRSSANPRSIMVLDEETDDEDGRSADDDTNAPSTSSWSPQRKNAYLAAMARKAREDFEKKQHKPNLPAPVRKERTNTDGEDDDADNVYNSFTATEKRKFLKHVNSGMTATESSQLILAEREKLQAEKAKEQELAEAKDGAQDKSDKKSPRFKFWKKGSKANDEEEKKNTTAIVGTAAALGTTAAILATWDHGEGIATDLETPKRTGKMVASGETNTDAPQSIESLKSESKHGMTPAANASPAGVMPKRDLGDEFGISESFSDEHSPGVAVGAKMVVPKQSSIEDVDATVAIQQATVAKTSYADPLTDSPTTVKIGGEEKKVEAEDEDERSPTSARDRSNKSPGPEFALPKRGNNFYDAVRVVRPEEDDSFALAPSPKSQSKRSKRLASIRVVSPRAQGFSSMGEKGKDTVVPLNDDEDQQRPKILSGALVARRKAPLSQPSIDDGRRRILGMPIPGSKLTGFTTLDDDGLDIQQDQGNSSNHQESNELEDLEKNLLRPVPMATVAEDSTDNDILDHHADGFDITTPKSMAATPNNGDKVAVAGTVNLGTYLDSTSPYSGGQSQDHMSVVSGKSGWTAATGMTGSSSFTQSSRKRRPGAAKERLAKAKEAEKTVATKKGWHQSIRASAMNFNTPWDPDSGFADFRDIIVTHAEVDMDTVPTTTNGGVNDLSDQGHQTNASKQVSNQAGTNTLKAAVSPIEPSLVPEGQARASLRGLQPVPTKPNGWLDSIQTSASDPPQRNTNNSTPYGSATTETPMTAAGVQIPRQTAPDGGFLNDTLGKTPAQIAASTTQGWQESMKAVSAEIGQESGAKWDPQRGWVALDRQSVEPQQIRGVRDSDRPSTPRASDPPPPPDGRPLKNVTSHVATVSTAVARPSEVANKLGESSKQTISGVPPDDKSPLSSWIQKSGKKSHSELSTEGSDQAVASTSEEKYVQLGDNGSVRSFAKDQSPTAPTMPLRKKVDPPAMVNALPGTTSPSILTSWTEDTGNDLVNEDDKAPLLGPGEKFQRSSDERATPVQVVKEKCDEDDIDLFSADAQDSARGAPALSPKRGSGPVDLDDSVGHITDSDDEDDWGSDSYLQGQVSNKFFSSETRAKIPEAPVPRLNRPAKDTSPLRERVVAASRIVDNSTNGDYKRDVGTDQSLADADSRNVTDAEAKSNESVVDANTGNSNATYVTAASVVDATTGNSNLKYVTAELGTAAVVGTTGAFAGQSTERRNEVENTNATRSTTSPGNLSPPLKLSTPSAWRMNSETVISTDAPALYTSASHDTDVSTPSAVSSSVKLRAQQWETLSGNATTSTKKGSRSPMVSPVQNTSPMPVKQLGIVPQETEVDWPETNEDQHARIASPSGSAAAYKAFLGKKVRAESAAAAKKEETLTREIISPDAPRPKYGSTGPAKLQGNEHDTDDDSLFEFQSTSDTGHRVDTVMNQAVLRNSLALGSQRNSSRVSEGAFPDISPIQTQDEDDSVGDGSSGNKYETTSDTGTNIEQGSFFKRLSACAAPIIPRQFSQHFGDDSVPMAHLAFLKTNPPLTRGTPSASAGNRSASRFVPPTLCGRPDTILEDANEGTSPLQASGAGNNFRSTPLTHSTSNTNDFKSSSSVVSGEFGAKTSYLESLAMKAAVADPKRSGSRSKSRGKSRSGSSETSTSSKQSSEKWNEFIERKSQTGASPGQMRSSTDISKASEMYAAEKVEEMMEAMSSKSLGRHGGNTEKVNAMLDNMAGMDNSGQSLPSYEMGRDRSSDTRSSSRSKSVKKSESAKAAEELAAARVEAMMAAMTSNNLDEGEI